MHYLINYGCKKFYDIGPRLNKLVSYEHSGNDVVTLMMASEANCSKKV